MSNKMFGMKIIYIIEVGEKRFYEQMILSVVADSFEDASVKADRYAREYCGEYVNPRGELVKVSEYKIIDVFQAFDEEDDVQEIYSEYLINESDLSEEEYYKIITQQCGEEKLYDLRNKEFN